jgi:hypothetical protein
MGMKPFDLERAKAGDPVITRKGLPARHVCSFNGISTYNNIFIITNDDGIEQPRSYTNDGVSSTSVYGKVYDYDLFMAPTKKEGWINIYPGEAMLRHCNIFTTRDAAIAHAFSSLVATVKIEWEE